jgi:hypothetical protein
MAGLVVAGRIYPTCAKQVEKQDVDARHKAGHDEREVCDRIEGRIAGVN